MIEGADLLNAHAYELMLAGHYPQATYMLRRALELDEKNVHARNNLASCLKQLGREDEAIRHYEALIADAPDFLYAINNLAFSYLRNGRYAEGWNLYHSRRAAHIKIITVNNPVTGKPFLGEPLPTLEEMHGKDVVLVLEQGIGDELFFLRFAPKLIELAQPRTVWYAPGIKAYPLLKRIPMGVRLTDASFCEVDKANAVAIPLADLPFACGHDGTWFPPTLRLPGYENTEEDLYDKQIGVTWRAGSQEMIHKGGMFKQLPPEELGHALRGVPGRVVVMQRNPGADELEAFRRGYGADVEVYERNKSPAHELLELVNKLDSLSEYVGVSNTDMYLLALIGCTAHTLVIRPPEWRWFGPQCPESPWFPGFRRYHQDVHGWAAALERLRADLTA